jgi:hypothetical protein
MAMSSRSSGAFAKLRKATNSFVESVGPSVCPHETTRLPLDGFSKKFYVWVFIENLSRKFNFLLNLARIEGALHEDRYTLLSFIAHFLLTWEMLQEKIWRENQNTCFMSNTFFFFENRAIYEMMWKNIVQPDMPQMSVAHAHCMPDT